MAGTGAALPKPRGARDSRAGTRTRARDEGSRHSGRVGRAGLTWLTPRCRARILSSSPCFPLQKFPALSLPRSFPPECPFQLPLMLCSPSCAHPAAPSQPTLLGQRAGPQGLGWPWLSWCRCPCPLCSHPCMLQHSPGTAGRQSCRHCCRIRFS